MNTFFAEILFNQKGSKRSHQYVCSVNPSRKTAMLKSFKKVIFISSPIKTLYSTPFSYVELSFIVSGCPIRLELKQAIQSAFSRGPKRDTPVPRKVCPEGSLLLKLRILLSHDNTKGRFLDLFSERINR